MKLFEKKLNWVFPTQGGNGLQIHAMA